MHTTDYTGVITIDQLLQVGQVVSDAEAAHRHQYALALAHRHVSSVRAAEHDDGVDGVVLLGVFQQLPGETPLRLNQKIEGILLLGCPRDDRGRVSLEEGLEADGRDPQVHILPGVDPQRLREAELHLDRARVVGDGSA